MTPSLEFIVIFAVDLERSRRFYEALGLSFSLEKHGNGPEHLAAVIDGVVFEIYPRKGDSASTGVRLGFRVASVEAAVAAARLAGAEVASLSADGLVDARAGLIDPDGHRVVIRQ